MLSERASITENRYRWYVVMAQVRAAGEDYDTATRLLDQAEALYGRGFYPDLRPIAAMKARVQIAAGDLSPANEWAEDLPISVDDQPNYLREYEHLTLVRMLLAQHRAGSQVDDGGRWPVQHDQRSLRWPRESSYGVASGYDQATAGNTIAAVLLRRRWHSQFVLRLQRSPARHVLLRVTTR